MPFVRNRFDLPEEREAMTLLSLYYIILLKKQGFSNVLFFPAHPP